MQCNVGSIDRIIRLVAGIGLAIGGVIFESYWGLLGVVLLATAVFRYCPLYPLFKINTNKKES
jgi:NhaP-type Na+/H+ or K+/H+ antiporter